MALSPINFFTPNVSPFFAQSRREDQYSPTDPLSLSAGETREDLLGKLPDGWKMLEGTRSIPGVTTLIKKQLLLPLDVPSGASDQTNNSRPYLSTPLSLLPLFHEIQHTKQKIPDLRHALVTTLSGKQTGWSPEERIGREINATEVAINDVARLIDKGFEFGEEFTFEAVCEEIQNALASYSVPQAQIDKLVTLAKSKLFGEKKNR